MSPSSQGPRWTAALKDRARRLFAAAVAAADPEEAVARAIVRDEAGLAIRADGGLRRGDWRRVRAVAFGKAACAMARGALRSIPEGLFASPGVAVTNYENVVDVPGFRVIGAGHPLPDENGLAGAEAVAAEAEKAAESELLLVLISGGGSALLPCPPPGISLMDKIATTDLLLASGADIAEINTVRKHLSRLKGGGLARLAAPADLHALILSDVLGDDLSTIASGPTVPDPTTFADAKAVLVRRGIWERVPAPARDYIVRGIEGAVPETPKPGDPVFGRAATTLVGSNALSLARLAEAAREAGYYLIVHDRELRGEARAAARRFAEAAAAAIAREGARRLALVAGGETTVTIKGRGKGGRNQEMALAFAIAAERAGLGGRWVFLSGGTDGRDGPTDAAGGIVDPGTLARIRAHGADPMALLDDNGSYRALELAGDLLRTGPTGTNVADLQVLLIEP